MQSYSGFSATNFSQHARQRDHSFIFFGFGFSKNGLDCSVSRLLIIHPCRVLGSFWSQISPLSVVNIFGSKHSLIKFITRINFNFYLEFVDLWAWTMTVELWVTRFLSWAEIVSILFQCMFAPKDFIDQFQVLFSLIVCKCINLFDIRHWTHLWVQLEFL